MAKNRPPLRMTLGALLLLSLTGACQPALHREPVSAKQDLGSPPSLSLEMLDKRILHLNRLLETQNLSREDRELAQDLLATYRALKTSSQNDTLREDYPSVVNRLLRDLEQTEERCFGKPSAAASLSSEGVRQLASKRKRILDGFSSGRDQEVIDGVLELEKSFSREFVTPDLSLLLALSLGKKGSFNRALSVGQDAAGQLEEKPDLIDLRSKMIEWQLALGNEKEAEQGYERLKENLVEREALVRALEQRIASGSSKGSPAEAGASKEDLTKADLERDLRDAFTKAEDSVQKGDFERAKFILFQQRIRFEEGLEADLIDQALRSVENAEQKARQQPKTEIAAKEPSSAEPQKDVQREVVTQDSLKTALNLIRNERYEEAIRKLDAMPPGDPDVRELKNSAVEKIINRERNKAAKLFLEARNTQDPAKKTAMLNSSYNLLKAMVDKYPTSPLIPKVQDNMNQVTKELSKVKKGEG
jgi:hypothetical protein